MKGRKCLLLCLWLSYKRSSCVALKLRPERPDTGNVERFAGRGSGPGTDPGLHVSRRQERGRAVCERGVPPRPPRPGGSRYARNRNQDFGIKTNQVEESQTGRRPAPRKSPEPRSPSTRPAQRLLLDGEPQPPRRPPRGPLRRKSSPTLVHLSTAMSMHTPRGAVTV